MKITVRMIVCLIAVLLCAILVSCASSTEQPSTAPDSRSAAPSSPDSGTTQSAGSPASEPTPTPPDEPLPPESEGLAFTLNESGTGYNLAGIGTCTDTVVVVPSVYEGLPVTGSVAQAFKKQTQLTRVYLPESMKTLGDYLFIDCTALENVRVPEDFTQIGDGLFTGCTSFTGRQYEGVRYAGSSVNPYKILVSAIDQKIEKVVIHERTEYIQTAAFTDCKSFTEVRIPENVRLIASKAFYFCRGLKTVYWDAVNAVQEGAFTGCSKFTDLIFGDRVKSIPNFENCRSLSELTLPAGMTEIAPYAFRECSGLVTVELPETIRTIGAGAFFGCSKLQNINMPIYLESVGADAFTGCTALRLADFGNGKYLGSGENPYLILIRARDAKIDGAVISDDTRIVCSGAFKECVNLRDILIPDSVTSLGAESFYGCTSLASVIIGDGITEIAENTFGRCTSLRYLTLPSRLKTIGDGAFFYCPSLEDVVLPARLESIGAAAFGACGDAFRKLRVPENLTYIAPGAFRMSGIGQISVAEGNPVFRAVDGCLVDASTKTVIVATSTAVVPEGVEHIGPAAFYGNLNRRIDIPEGVRTIDAGAFAFCLRVSCISLPSTLQWADDQAFMRTRPFVVFDHTDSRLSCGSTDFGGVALYAYAVVDRDGEKHYAGGEYEWEYDLTDDLFFYRRVSGVWTLMRYVGDQDAVTLPESHNGEPYRLRSFMGANEVTVPASLGTIPEQAFAVVSRSYAGSDAAVFGVRVVHLEEGITSIGDQAFSGSMVEQIHIPASVTSIGKAICSMMNGTLTEITVDQANTVYYAAGNCLIERATGTVIAGCSASVIPDDGSVSGIAAGAFVGCPELTGLTIPASVLRIEEGAIVGTDLTKITVAEGNPVCKAVDNCLILQSGQGGVLLFALPGAVIPDDGSVIRIGESAFASREDLRMLSLPKSITSVGAGAFRFCSRLLSVNYAGTAEDAAGIVIDPSGNEYLTDAKWTCAK